MIRVILLAIFYVNLYGTVSLRTPFVIYVR